MATYLADKSAVVRLMHPKVKVRYADLFLAGQLATCAVIDLEILFSAKNATEWQNAFREREYMPQVAITPTVTDRALEVQFELSKKSQHRLPIADLMIAAAAEVNGLAVLHYDADFEMIAKVTKQAHEWIAKKGSL